jgi:hypothetical protein
MWTYNQTRGWLDKDGILVSKACYSGFGEGFNNPAMETVEGVGPICAGPWLIVGPPFTDPKLGPYVLKLVPANLAFRARILAMGRDPDSFRFHGKPLPPADINSGSHGCLCGEEPTRCQVYQSGDTALDVISGLFPPDVA